MLTGLKFRPLPLPTAATTLRITFGPPLALRLGQGPASRVAAAVLDAAQALRLKGLRPPAGYQVEEVPAAGPEFDDLWERTRGQFANTNQRDAAALDWVCHGNPDRGKLLLACRQGGLLVGYMITEPWQEGGEKGLYCLDAWWDLGQPLAAKALAAGCLLWAWRQGYDFLRVRHYHPALAEALARLPGARRREIPHRQYYWAKRETADRLRQGPSYLVDLEGDNGL